MHVAEPKASCEPLVVGSSDNLDVTLDVAMASDLLCRAQGGLSSIGFARDAVSIMVSIERI